MRRCADVPDDLDVDDYELLDAGDGARLERFGSRVVARPQPAVEGSRQDPAAWSRASLTFQPGDGWTGPDARPSWEVSVAGLRIELRATATGQVGMFPEQAASWEWLRDRVRPARAC